MRACVRESKKRRCIYLCVRASKRERAKRGDNISVRAGVGDIERAKRGDVYICACVLGRERVKGGDEYIWACVRWRDRESKKRR